MPDFEYYARTPRSQRPRLSREDFAAKYGASAADLDLVPELAQHGSFTNGAAQPLVAMMTESGVPFAGPMLADLVGLCHIAGGLMLVALARYRNLKTGNSRRVEVGL